MKHKIIISLLCVFIAIAVKGQPGGQGGPGGMNAESMTQRETEWMKGELTLSADQTSKVEAINLKYAKEQMSAFQGGPGGDPEARQKQMADMNEKKRTELQAILSAEQ